MEDAQQPEAPAPESTETPPVDPNASPEFEITLVKPILKPEFVELGIEIPEEKQHIAAQYALMLRDGKRLVCGLVLTFQRLGAVMIPLKTASSASRLTTMNLVIGPQIAAALACDLLAVDEVRAVIEDVCNDNKGLVAHAVQLMQYNRKGLQEAIVMFEALKEGEKP